MSTNLRFDCITDKEYRPVHGDFITRLALRMSISDLAETLPMNLCVLIDKSMSMIGSKMDEAIASARQLAAALRPEDQLSIITFSTTAEVLLENRIMDDTGKSLADEALQSICGGGLTRMDLALEKAYELLARTGVTHLNMLLMLSDGAPTNHVGYVLEGDELDGLKDSIAKALTQNGIITSTIGLGDAEACLAPFLGSCAETGQGVFYHESDGGGLAQRFLEELNRVKDTAITEARFHVDNLDGQIRKAAAIYPDLRQLTVKPEKDGSLVLNVGALQKGEEHTFLLEVITHGDGSARKKKLCDLAVSYRMDGQLEGLSGQPPILEYTDDETLLAKPGHEDVEKYKAMYMAFQQTCFAAENVRTGGDPKKTKVLLQSAAKTTRRLGMTKQTKLLNAMADQVDGQGTLNENQLATIATTTRKTKVLNAS